LLEHYWQPIAPLLRAAARTEFVCAIVGSFPGRARKWLTND
jgi:hypothetical protein